MNISYYQKLLICALATTISLLSVEREGKQAKWQQEQYRLARWSLDEKALVAQLRYCVRNPPLFTVDEVSLLFEQYALTNLEITSCARALKEVAPRELLFSPYDGQKCRVAEDIMHMLNKNYGMLSRRIYNERFRTRSSLNLLAARDLAITRVVHTAMEIFYTSPVRLPLPPYIAHLKARMEYGLPRYSPLFGQVAYGKWFASAPVTKAYRADEVPALPHLSSSFTWPKRIQEDDQEGLS